MDFQEFGIENEKTMLLLPGTAISWQLNFKNVLEEWAEKYHLICVNYDGFEGDPTKCFTDILTVVEKIEDYLIEHYDGCVDGAYGSSLGGSVVGLLVQRRQVHISHAFIGSSDLDQGNRVVAWMMAAIASGVLMTACANERRRETIKRFLEKRGVIGGGEEAKEFIDGFIKGVENLHPKTIARQFYSDYVTPLDDDIHVAGTTFHVIYALKMGKKYGARYRQHFHAPDIHIFDMKHEVWLYDKAWQREVMDVIDRCMNIPCGELI